MKKTYILIILLLCFSTLICEAEDRFFEIKAKKFSYNPNIIKINRGDNVKIKLISEDVHHGFYLDGYGLETSAHPGQEGVITFTANKTGKFSYRCSVTCGEFHPYMIGYLTVEPNTRFLTYLIILFVLGGASFLILMVKRENV